MTTKSVPASMPIAEPRVRRAPQPFPEIPAGVTIVPFRDFKECGIQLPSGNDDDGVERDAHGIATIPLRAKHDTDVSKTVPGKKRTPREWAASRPNFRKEWWVDWAEGEDVRNHGPYSAEQSAADRFQQAAHDFQRYRKFPPYATKVQYMWEQFKLFAGLLGTTPVWYNPANNPKAGGDSEEDFDSDMDDDHTTANRRHQGGDGRFPPRPRPRAPYERFGKRPTVVHGDAEVHALLDEARAEREERKKAFLEEPGRHIQVFLSSYMLNEGLAWEDRHLVNAPHLLQFFVNYLIRNKVFVAEERIQESLRAALPVIQQAVDQLPRTAQLAKIFPDAFSVACRELWGDQGTAEIVIPDVEDIVEAQKEDQGNVDPSAFAPLNEPNSVDVWTTTTTTLFFSRLGPTTFPLTHQPGVVERSVRRIISIFPPKCTGTSSATLPAALTVEGSLRGESGLALWRVVLEPWANWAGVGEENNHAARLLAETAPADHDLAQTLINLVVEGAVARKLVVGMGMGGTWVQLARVDDHADDAGNGKRETMWYCEALDMVVPSYWLTAV